VLGTPGRRRSCELFPGRDPPSHPDKWPWDQSRSRGHFHFSSPGYLRTTSSRSYLRALPCTPCHTSRCQFPETNSRATQLVARGRYDLHGNVKATCQRNNRRLQAGGTRVQFLRPYLDGRPTHVQPGRATSMADILCRRGHPCYSRIAWRMQKDARKQGKLGCIYEKRSRPR
jgi:hypothetical protein